MIAHPELLAAAREYCRETARSRRDAARSHQPDPGGVRGVTVVVKAPDLMTATIVGVFGLVCAAWLFVGPPDPINIHLTMLLPPLASYDVGWQCAEAPGERG